MLDAMVFYPEVIGKTNVVIQSVVCVLHEALKATQRLLLTDYALV